MKNCPYEHPKHGCYICSLGIRRVLRPKCPVHRMRAAITRAEDMLAEMLVPSKAMSKKKAIKIAAILHRSRRP